MRRLLLLIVLLLPCSLVLAHGSTQEPKDAQRLRVLVYSNTADYRHEEIPAVNRWLVLQGDKHAMEVDVTEHWKDLQPESLAKYQVLVLNNANALAEVIPAAQREAVEAWYGAGGGIVGLHAALVRQQGWPWLSELGGCDFDSDSEYVKAKVLVDPEAKDHPAVKGQPDEFWYEADWTNHTRSVTGLPGFQVLLRVDESTYEPVRDLFKELGGKPMGEDHPIAWTNTSGGGRFFYTQLGHDVRSLDTPFGRRHVMSAIRWAAASEAVENRAEENGADERGARAEGPIER
ncbi:MAG: ThuA domain-containing protein [Planctomycetota bacterium]|nr:MAG: ThuA domain-containing protein [Planctomycetota bacterium]REJ92661.1 MAG: ThuA domain-containing protein [Planctomycetota bacterium]